MSCMLAGSVVILVYSSFSLNPVKRIACSVESFLLAGSGVLGISAPFPMHEYVVQSALEKKKTRGKMKALGNIATF